MDDKSKAKAKTLFLIIDANSVVHRAYHALPPLTTKKGELVNAVYGFLLVFLKAIKDFQPDYIAAAFDFPAPTFRHKKFKEYKAKRPPTPKELSGQIPKIKEVLRAFSVSIFEKQGFEADDIIGTLVLKSNKLSEKENLETIIISGDLDVLQLVGKDTKVYFLRRGVKDVVLYNQDLVREKFQGLFPEQLLDFKALKGDASDNIPGVVGIGEKTAIELIKEFGILENLYQKLNQKNGKTEKLRPKLKEMLVKQKERAFLSRDLVRIDRNVSLDSGPKECRWKNYDKEKISRIFKKLEFYSLIGRLSPSKAKTASRQEKLFGNEEAERKLTLWRNV